MRAHLTCIPKDVKMIHDFVPTIAIAIIGISAAKLSDLLRTPRTGRKTRDTAHAWRYKTEAAPRKTTWLLPPCPQLHPCGD
jgi:hypothetical protein